MSAILTSLGSIVTAVISMAGDVVDYIVAEPLALLYVLIPLVGIGVGMFKRLINVN